MFVESEQQGLSFARQSLEPAEIDALARENLFIRESLPTTSFGAKWGQACRKRTCPPTGMKVEPRSTSS
jgi:hypothetical protein